MIEMSLFSSTNSCIPEISNQLYGFPTSQVKLYLRRDVLGSRSISDEEINSMIFPMSDDKAPGLEEFSMAFFQQCLEIIKKDIIDLLKEFHSNDKI